MKGKSFLFMSLTLFLFFISVTIYANNSSGILLDKILFFESGSEIPAKQDRQYLDNFRPESQYIYIEFNIKNLNFNIESREYNLTFIWKYLNGDIFGRSDAIFNVKSDWETAYISRGWGFSGKGNWRLGRFTAQILINDSLFAEKDFFITPFEKDFISLPEVNYEMPDLQTLPESIHSKILHQYKIEPYPFLNYFYDINFSSDGMDIAYALSHFEHTSSSTGTSTTRDMFLFRNNKQIIPNYFMIRYNFDRNLKNLAHFGLKLTTSNIYEANGYGYYNGLQLYKSTGYLPIIVSADGKKYSYIMNTMPGLKSSFTWDAAYEFLMINNQKVQPEWLKIAKSIKISEASADIFSQGNSIVYLKNQENSYHAVYTAKYKFDNQHSYALFNEAERISPQFDGYISRPYLSADEEKVACIVKDKKEWFIIMNDKRITKGYSEIKHDGLFKTIKDEIIFCESGNNVIYQAKIKGDWYLMKGDEIVSDGYSDIESIVVGPDDNKIAYKAKSGKKWSVYVNKTKVSPDFDFIGEEIVFSPDGNKIAYAAANGDNMFVMTGSQQISPNFKILHQSSMYIGKQPLAITNLVINNTGERVAYKVAFEYSGDDLAYKMNHSFVMMNDTQVSPKMYNTSVYSKKPGELFYAGIDISDLVLHHVQIDF